MLVIRLRVIHDSDTGAPTCSFARRPTVPELICSSWITSGWTARSSSTSCFVTTAVATRLIRNTPGKPRIGVAASRPTGVDWGRGGSVLRRPSLLRRNAFLQHAFSIFSGGGRGGTAQAKLPLGRLNYWSGQKDKDGRYHTSL